MPPAKGRILVVDDNPKMVRLLCDQLGDAGYSVEIAEGGAAAIERARSQPFDVVLTDLRMEGVDGFDVLRTVRALDDSIAVLIMTAFGAVDTAIEAIKAGAFHYITKPFKLAEVLVYIERALADRRLRDENRALLKVAEERSRFGDIVGHSEVMRRLYDAIERVARSTAPVLIRGESGVGKELVARALHFNGPRRERAFVAVNCTALPEPLLESELFGHVRGAYTGASTVRRGLLAEADGGTLFLDEIGDMPPGVQAKLLRVLEDGAVRPVGADAARFVDLRVIAATNQDLEARVADGRFRADLFYRLSVVPLVVPPLRERLEDLPSLVGTFVARARVRNPDSRVRTLGAEVMQAFARSSWPGNVRELQNVVQRLVIMGTNETVTLADLEAHAPHVLDDGSPLSRARRVRMPLKELEREYIAWILDQCGGNKARAAEILQIDVSTLYRREKSS